MRVSHHKFQDELCHLSVIMTLFFFLGPRSSDIPQVDVPQPEEHRSSVPQKNFHFSISRFTVRRLLDSPSVSVKCVPVSGFSSQSGSALQTEAGDIILMPPTLITASKQARLTGTTIHYISQKSIMLCDGDFD